MLGQSLTQDNIDTINNTLSNPAPEANIGDVLSNPLLLFTGGGKRDFIPSSTGRAPKGEDTGVSARSLGKRDSTKRNTLLKEANEKGKTVLDDIESKDGKDSKRYKDAKDALETVKNAIEQKPTLGFKKGALVKKPKRKPKAKRKSLGQRI